MSVKVVGKFFRLHATDGYEGMEVQLLSFLSSTGKFFRLHATDGYEGMEVQLRSFLSSTLDGSK
jgi:hypothetical protein